MRWMNVEFDPPSDFVEAPSGGGGKKKWLKIFGIGCAGFLLIAGLLTVAGVVKGISCCSDLTNAGLTVAGASVYGEQFSDAARSQQFDTAYDMLNPNLQAEISKQELQSMYGQDWLASSIVISDGVDQMNTRAESIDDIKNIKNWDLKIRMYPEQGDKQLVTLVGVEVIPGAEKKEAFEDTNTYKIYKLKVSEETIIFEDEPPAQAVLELHGALQSGNLDRARRHMLARNQGQEAKAAFKAFIDERGELFTRSTMTIKDARYNTSDSATVTAVLKTEEKAATTVKYTVQKEPTRWSIDEISVQEAASAPIEPTAVEEPAEPAGTEDSAEEVPADGE